MACRIVSESNTMQVHEIFLVGFNLPALGGDTMHSFGSVFRPCLSHHQFVMVKSVCGVEYRHRASFDPYKTPG